MRIVTPEKIWNGEDAYIIGGGHSLRGFDWSLLHDKKTIGCNTAFKLGEDVCDVLMFSDLSWFEHYEEELKNFKNPIWTNASGFSEALASSCWLNVMNRGHRGMFHDSLGWNGHTGASAINLALLFGVKRLYLLGYDMFRTKKHSNFHDEIIHHDAVKVSSYVTFRDRFHWVVESWKEKWPDVEIYNVTDNSLLEGIPKISAKEFWGIDNG